jgi:hypothetical protein
LTNEGIEKLPLVLWILPILRSFRHGLS